MPVTTALRLILCLVLVIENAATVLDTDVLNITRKADGDVFTLGGSQCGPTRCSEASHGTAVLSPAGLNYGKCVCQCRHDLPTFMEDSNHCVNGVTDCQMPSFGHIENEPKIAFAHLPLKGQIILPEEEILFTEVTHSICYVSKSEYLSTRGWMTLRDIADNDIPFGVYRSEEKTYLQWIGSSVLQKRLMGRVVRVHVLCQAYQHHVASPCAVFRLAGTAVPNLLDDFVKSIPFSDGVGVSTDSSSNNQGLTVLQSLSIGFCALMLIMVYTAGIIYYIHFKKRQKRKKRNSTSSNSLSTINSSLHDPRLEMETHNMKTNPLLKLDPFSVTMRPEEFGHIDSALSDVSERTEETLDPPPSESSMKKSRLVTAMVHTTRKKSNRLTGKFRPTVTQRQLTEISAPIPITRGPLRTPSPDIVERRPASDVNIVEDKADLFDESPPGTTSSLRRKLYFNPVFFEFEHLKNPPPAAKEFLVKIREVMNVAKDKMTSKRFAPVLNPIPEEQFYKTIDFGWDIPSCVRGRKLSVVSLKRENIRKRHQCSGCPGCDEVAPRLPALARSNSCKSCLSEEFKQRIVRKWLDDVPVSVHTKHPPPQRSIAKVSGTPRVVQPKTEAEKEASKRECEEKRSSVDSSTTPSPPTSSSPPRVMRRPRRKMPPPPPPPENITPVHIEEPTVLPEVKKKMEAVIKELSDVRLAETKVLREVQTETAVPISPKVFITVVATESTTWNSHRNSQPNGISDMAFKNQYEIDSLERGMKTQLLSLAPRLDLALESNSSDCADRSLPVSEVFIDPPPVRHSPTPGALTIKVQGYPEAEPIRNPYEDFDPDTLDRKFGKKWNKHFPPPVKETAKRVDKILLRSAGSFKIKATDQQTDLNEFEPPSFNRSIGSLRQIFEEKAKAAATKSRRFSYDYGEMTVIPTFSDDYKPPDLILHVNGEPKPPLPPKQTFNKYASDQNESRSLKFRWSERNRKSARKPRQRTKSPRKGKPEDSGYLSTDSNESKKRSRFVLRLKSTPQREDSESEGSACDGRSESGGESVETSSVLFGRYVPSVLDDAAPDSGFVAQDSDCDRSVVSVISSTGIAIQC